MKSSAEATTRNAAIEATYRVTMGSVASDWARAAAQHARRNIVDGYTPVEDYPTVTAYFNGIADALMSVNA
jgi:hypothetical protein